MYLPLIKMAVTSLAISLVMPSACHGSMDPLGNTTFLTLTPYPPYSVLVRAIPFSNWDLVNLLP